MTEILKEKKNRTLTSRTGEAHLALAWPSPPVGLSSSTPRAQAARWSSRARRRRHRDASTFQASTGPLFSPRRQGEHAASHPPPFLYSPALSTLSPNQPSAAAVRRRRETRPAPELDQKSLS